MDFAFSEEQQALSASARAVLAGDPGWASVAGLGWPALIVPEAHGGAALGAVELSIVMEALGRTLSPLPFFATTALATPALLEAGGAAPWLERIAGGELTATLCSLDADRIEGLSVRRGTAQRVSGRYRHVVDGATAELLVVAARDDDDGASLFVVQADRPGVTRTALPTLDATRALADLVLDDVEATRIGPAAPALARALARATVALAAEQLGAAERCLEMAVEYAGTRVQFGRAIGSFQAIKHKLSDMLVRVESARSAAYWAAWVADREPAALAEAAAVAKATCSEALFECAADNIQIHGGIGFTWEHAAHRYFKRARSSMTLLGDATLQRERYARAIGL